MFPTLTTIVVLLAGLVGMSATSPYGIPPWWVDTYLPANVIRLNLCAQLITDGYFSGPECCPNGGKYSAEVILSAFPPCTVNMTRDSLSYYFPRRGVEVQDKQNTAYCYTGTIPSALGLSSTLKKLILVDSLLTGTIPVLPNLVLLKLDDNLLNGTIPCMAGLTLLTVSRNRLTGTVPGCLSKLEVFAGVQNFFSGLQVLPDARHLVLQNNRFTTFPFALSQMKSLQSLRLDNNDISGTLPSFIGLSAFPSLTMFTLSGNRLSGTIPSSFLQSVYFKRPIHISLSDNRLEGALPSSLNVMVSSLSFSNNRLNGTIPSSLGKLIILTGLFLSNNQLTGTIPSSLKSLTDLKELSLNDNMLTGSIPYFLFHLPKLRKLALHSNLFVGQLPPLTKMIFSTRGYVSLNNNLLTGTFPLEMSFASINNDRNMFCLSWEAYYDVFILSETLRPRASAFQSSFLPSPPSLGNHTLEMANKDRRSFMLPCHSFPESDADAVTECLYRNDYFANVFPLDSKLQMGTPDRRLVWAAKYKGKGLG